MKSAPLLAGMHVLLASASSACAAPSPQAFLERHCFDCHDAETKEAGLDLTALTFDLADAGTFSRWVQVHDRVQAGEMPPDTEDRPDPAESESFVRELNAALVAFEQELTAREGRAKLRRLNRYEYENALRDLLQAPWLQVKDQLPQDGEAHRFNKSGEALDISHVLLARYLSVADSAMRQVVRTQVARPATRTTRYYAREEHSLTHPFTRYAETTAKSSADRRTFPVLGGQAQPEIRLSKAPLTVGDADPHTREQEAIGWTSSHYVGFQSGWGNFQAPVTGRYRIRFSGYTLWVGPFGYWNEKWPRRWWRPNHDDISPGRRSEPITVYAKGSVLNRRLGAFDVSPEPTVSELDPVWLSANDSIVTDASRFYRTRPTGRELFEFIATNPLAEQDGAPAVAFRWMEVEGPLYDDSIGAGYRLLFGDLPLKITPRGGAESEQQDSPPDRRGRRAAPAADWEVASADPQADAARLVRAFLRRAYRRPVKETEVQQVLAIIDGQFRAGQPFADAMLAGYSAVLCSPGFIFVEEKPGRLDDDALATRLALFLWNSEPDEALRDLAARRELHRPEVLRAQAERLLDDPKSRRFVEAFLDYWIDIRKLEDTTPSTTLYNDYTLDDSLTEAALEETRLYFQELLRRDLPARTIVDSDFTFLNERLALHYDVPGVDGAAMRRVTLPGDSPRGGFMTQASVLKVTANGTTTSPVLRGVWIRERILGYETPPPPPVAAVEPDIRGAVTIREQLKKHRADPSCAACHSQIDPPGFALESFDVMGGWRDRYRGVSDDQPPAIGFGKDGHPFVFHFGLPVDSTGELPDGRTFQDVREFKRLLLEEEVQIARNLARQLVIYATGAPVRFSDRAQIERILQRTRPGDYGVRHLVQEIIQSDLFLNK